MGDFLFIQRGHDGFNDVCAILIQRIIAAAGEVGVRAVVVHRQAAAQIQNTHGGAFLDESAVDPTGFEHPGANVADVGNLRTQMVMQQLEQVLFALGAQSIHHVD